MAKIGIIGLGIGIGYSIYEITYYHCESVCQNIPNTTHKFAEYIYSSL